GALHACDLAAGLGIPKVIVPAMPGALSAYGILVSDIVKDFSRTLLLQTTAGRVPMARLKAEFVQLEELAKREFKNEEWSGRPKLNRSVDLRYRGQGFELNVPYDTKMLQAFHREHQRRYGYSNPEREVEIVTLRLRATKKSREVRGSIEHSHSKSDVTMQRVWFAGKAH